MKDGKGTIMNTFKKTIIAAGGAAALAVAMAGGAFAKGDQANQDFINQVRNSSQYPAPTYQAPAPYGMYGAPTAGANLAFPTAGSSAASVQNTGPGPLTGEALGQSVNSHCAQVNATPERFSQADISSCRGTPY
jgi:hypothetical protein